MMIQPLHSGVEIVGLVGTDLGGEELNYFDSSIRVQFSFLNQPADMEEQRQSIHIPDQRDTFYLLFLLFLQSRVPPFHDDSAAP